MSGIAQVIVYMGSWFYKLYSFHLMCLYVFSVFENGGLKYLSVCSHLWHLPVVKLFVVSVIRSDLLRSLEKVQNDLVYPSTESPSYPLLTIKRFNCFNISSNTLSDSQIFFNLNAWLYIWFAPLSCVCTLRLIGSIPYLGACYIRTMLTMHSWENDAVLSWVIWTIKSHSPGYEVGLINRCM